VNSRTSRSNASGAAGGAGSSNRDDCAAVIDRRTLLDLDVEESASFREQCILA
jgi:hypothetical protein